MHGNRDDLAKVAEGATDATERIAAASPLWNATLRTTCVATQLEGGHAMNALPQLRRCLLRTKVRNRRKAPAALGDSIAGGTDSR